MKILTISRGFPPNIGGISYSLKAFYDTFKKNQHKITLYIFPYDFNTKYDYPNNILNVFDCKKYRIRNLIQIFLDILYFLKVIFLLHCSFKSKFKIFLYYLKRIKLLINMMNSYEILKHYDKIYNYDIILAYESGLSAHIGYLIKKNRGKKLILVSHGNDILNKKLKELTKLVLQEANKIIVRSNFIKTLVSSKFNIEKSKIFICPDGVILEEYNVQEPKSEIRNELKLNHEEFIILSVGLLNLVRKGYDLTLKSLKSLRDDYSLDINNIKYILIGRDNLKVRTWLKSLAKQYDLESNFEILVDLSNELRNKYYKASDIFVMPSRDLKREGSVEGFGNVFIEAGYFSLPSVGSNTGGIPDAIKNEKSGFIIKDFEQLVKKIKLLYENISLRKNMGQYAHERVLKNFTWEKIYELYMKVFFLILI